MDAMYLNFSIVVGFWYSFVENLEIGAFHPSQVFRKISNFDPLELNDLTFWTPWLSHGKKTDSAQLLSVQGDPSPRGCGRGVLSAMVLQQLQPHVRKMKDTRFFWKHHESRRQVEK